MKLTADPLKRLLDSDRYLRPYEKVLRSRQKRIHETEEMLTCGTMSLAEFAAGHEYFGLHFFDEEWIFREWAPNADAVYLLGDMTGWLEKRGVCPGSDQKGWCMGNPYA